MLGASYNEESIEERKHIKPCKFSHQWQLHSCQDSHINKKSDVHILDIGTILFTSMYNDQINVSTNLNYNKQINNTRIRSYTQLTKIASMEYCANQDRWWHDYELCDICDENLYDSEDNMFYCMELQDKTKDEKQKAEATKKLVSQSDTVAPKKKPTPSNRPNKKRKIRKSCQIQHESRPKIVDRVPRHLPRDSSGRFCAKTNTKGVKIIKQSAENIPSSSDTESDTESTNVDVMTATPAESTIEWFSGEWVKVDDAKKKGRKRKARDSSKESYKAAPVSQPVSNVRPASPTPGTSHNFGNSALRVLIRSLSSSWLQRY